MRLWIDFQSRDLILILLIFIVTFILAFLSYRFTLPPLSSKKKVFLLVLRWLALFCLFLTLADPLLGISKKVWEKPEVALLLDSSNSMNIKDKLLTRKEVLRNLLEQKDFKGLFPQVEFHPYLFSDSLIPYELSEELPSFTGEATSIGNSLEKLKLVLKGKELSSVILISDGANNAGKDPVTVARNYNLPIYALGVGEFVPFKDLSIEKLRYEEVTYSSDKDTIRVSLKNQGYKGVKVPVILQEDKKILAQKGVRFNFSGEVQEIELVFEPEGEGIHHYQISVPKIEGEDFSQNNIRNFTQKVLKKRFRLLLVSQSLNWEYTFLKRILEINKDITFETQVYSKSGKALSTELPLNEKLEDFDLLVILDSPQFLVQHQETLRELLQRNGVSLLLLVGEEFFKGGTLLNSIDFLPFEIKKERKPLSQGFNLSLTPEGKIHPITRLSDELEENLSLWANLPPFEKITILKEKNGVRVLSFFKINQELFPGIIIKELEKGKIEVLTFSPLWKWDFLLWGIGKDNSAYRRFWQNSFRWLLSKEDLERFRISTDKTVYKRGEEIKFTSRVLDESYQKVKGAEIKIKLFPKGKEADSLILNLIPQENGDYSFPLSYIPTGEYLFKGEARQDDLILGTSSNKFKVESTSLEDEDLKPNKELLQEIAFSTGGEYFEPENFPSLLKSLNLEKKARLKIREIPLWDQPLLLILFVLFLSLEWFLRKRFQLL